VNQQGRKIEVDLVFKGNSTSATKALQDLETQTKRTSNAAQDAKKQYDQLYRRPGGSSTSTSSARPGSGPGGTGPTRQNEIGNATVELASKFTKLAAVLSMVIEVGKAASGYSRMKNNDFAKSNNLAGQEWIEQRPVIGYFARNIKEWKAESRFSEELGASDATRERNLGNEAVRSATSGLQSRRFNALSEAGQARARAAAGQRAGAVDRAGVRGRVGIRFEDEFVGLYQQRNQADLNQRRAAAAYDFTRNDEANKRNAVSSLQNQLDHISRKPTDFKANEMNEVAGRLHEAQNRLNEAIERRTKSEEELRSANADARSAATDLIRAERDRAKTLFMETRAGGVEFGAMNPTDRYDVYANLVQQQQHGYDSLSPFQRQQLLSNPLTREESEKKAFESAKNDPLMNEILRLQGKKSLGDMEKEVGELTAKLDLNVIVDSEALTAAIDAAMKANGLTIAEISMEAVRTLERQIRQNAEQGRVQQKLGVQT
jgi:hypothetical protein